MLVAFSWNGLPQFAARLIRRAMDQLKEHQCVVVGTRPSVPIEGMEEVLRCPIHWADPSRGTTWRALGLDVPDIYIQSGWAYPVFSSLGKEVKKSGGRVIGLSDANWRGDFRQLVLGPIAFRVFYRRHFDAMVVPGVEGHRLMQWFGMRPDRVLSGMLGADPSVFGGGPPLFLRPKTFLFVGQFIPRKEMIGLAKAFIRFHQTHPEWTLRLCGSGEQRDAIPNHENIVVEEFVQPHKLADLYREARFFVLPSNSEAWGVVVHEAALSGCGLILSDKIGSAPDLTTKINGIRFQAGNGDDLLRALNAAASLNEKELQEASNESRRLAEGFGIDKFALTIAGLVAQFEVA